MTETLNVNLENRTDSRAPVLACQGKQGFECPTKLLPVLRAAQATQLEMAYYLMKAVEELGDEAAEALFYHLSHRAGFQLRTLPVGLDRLHLALESLLGPGARVIEERALARMVADPVGADEDCASYLRELMQSYGAW